MNYYISDLHFGHKNVLKFDNRPYFTLTEMKEDIIKRWNERVKKNDNVYILGDVFWYNDEAVEILEQLKGNLFLLKGNHDRLNSEMEKYFVWVKDIAVIKDKSENGEEHHVVLSHFPIAHWQGQDHNPPYIHLYGHIHDGRDTRPFEQYGRMWEQATGKPFMAMNVGCMKDYMDYTPRTLDEIMSAWQNERNLRF